MDQQSILTPVGPAVKDENGLLVTPLRIFTTTPLDRLKKSVVFVDPDNIDHKVKRANKKAMEYYLETKVSEVKNGLASKLYAKYRGWDENFASVAKCFANFPIEVTLEYNKNIISYKNQSLLNYAEETFLRYIFKVESQNKYLLLQHKTEDIQSMKLLLTRYHKSYCNKIKKRMDWLKHEYGNSSAVLLTLTLDPKKFNQDKYEMWNTITKELRRFMEALRIHFKRAGRVFPKYLWAVEGQKNGNPHLHIVFFRSTRLVDWRQLLSYWGNGAIYINKTDDGQKVRYPINYVTGYITKTFGNTNFNNVRTQSLVWLFNLHSFNRSHGLIVPLNPKGYGDWTLSYLAAIEKTDNMLSEMDIIKSVLAGLFDPKRINGPPAAKGEYVITADDEEVYSTDSPFWANFFVEE